MSEYTALAYVAPLRLAGVAGEPLARSPDLTTLVARVRALAPGADVRVFARPVEVTYAGRPIVGIARGDGGAICLCGPAPPAAQA